MLKHWDISHPRTRRTLQRLQKNPLRWHRRPLSRNRKRRRSMAGSQMGRPLQEMQTCHRGSNSRSRHHHHRLGLQPRRPHQNIFSRCSTHSILVRRTPPRFRRQTVTNMDCSHYSSLIMRNLQCNPASLTCHYRRLLLLPPLLQPLLHDTSSNIWSSRHSSVTPGFLPHHLLPHNMRGIDPWKLAS